MRTIKILLPVALMLAALGLTQTAFAQSDACSAVAESAIDLADALCEVAGRNQACYGNVLAEVVPQEGVDDFAFEQAGDIVEVSALQSLRVTGWDEEAETWGVVLMRLQANLPDTLPGQNVTFLLMGATEVTSAVGEDDIDLNPMQAFYLNTGIGNAGCAALPDSGLMVQTPEGAGEISLTVNEVSVMMGSTVFFEADEEQGMTVSTLEGAAFFEHEGAVEMALPGSLMRVPMQRVAGRLRAAGPPADAQPYDLARMARMPIRVLQRQFEMRPALTRDEIDDFREQLILGELPCGEPGFPSCDQAAFMEAAAGCVAQRRGIEQIRGRDVPPCEPEALRAAAIDALVERCAALEEQNVTPRPAVARRCNQAAQRGD